MRLFLKETWRGIEKKKEKKRKLCKTLTLRTTRLLDHFEPFGSWLATGEPPGGVLIGKKHH